MRSCILIAAVLVQAACGDNLLPGGRPDSRMDEDGGGGDASTDGIETLAPHLLITEIDPLGTDQFVEIYNPTGQTVSLTDYYLADDNEYFRTPAHATVPIVVVASDFVARFPAGSSIGAHEIAVVAFDATAFEASYGVPPDFTLGAGGGGTPMLPIAVGTSPDLQDVGELLALYHWDGAADTIDDIDLFLHGNAPSAGNSFIAKLPVDGPDADVTPTAYAPDAGTLDDMQSDIAGDGTHKRIALEGSNELASGGNGITGHDETSEQTRVTWDSAVNPNNYTAGTPGSIPTALQ